MLDETPGPGQYELRNRIIIGKVNYNLKIFKIKLNNYIRIFKIKKGWLKFSK